jgi:hypothetical protein
VPNGFLKEYDEDEGGMITADGVKLRKTNRADFGSSDSFSDLPAPSLYDIVGDVIYFYPIPANGPTVTLWYYGRDLPLTANIENGWLREAPHLMACETGFMIELFIADPNGLKVYAGLVPEARKNFSDRVIERRQANLRTYYGKRQ